jgi:putative membrane protein
MEELYERVPVRDGLAGERTVLAAERTLLAYIRTAFALFVAGVTGAHFLSHPWLVGLSYVMLTLGIGSLGVGILRFRRSMRATRRMLDRLDRER